MCSDEFLWACFATSALSALSLYAHAPDADPDHRDRDIAIGAASAGRYADALLAEHRKRYPHHGAPITEEPSK